MQIQDEPLIGTAEAAQILGVDPATVLRWVASGDLPFVRKLPGATGAVLYDGAVVRRKAAERVIERARRQS